MYLPPPRLLGGPRIAELRQRNSHLCVPTEWIDGGCSVIDRIPRRIGILLARAEGVVSHSRRIDLESRAALMVVERVEDHLKEIGALACLIAADKPRCHALRAKRVEHARPDVESAVVVEKPNLSALCGRLPFLRIGLRELGDRFRSAPRLLVELPVDFDRSCSLRSLCDRRRRGVVELRLLREQRPREKNRQRRAEKDSPHNRQYGNGLAQVPNQRSFPLSTMKRIEPSGWITLRFLVIDEDSCAGNRRDARSCTKIIRTILTNVSLATERPVSVIEMLFSANGSYAARHFR